MKSVPPKQTISERCIKFLLFISLFLYFHSPAAFKYPRYILHRSFQEKFKIFFSNFLKSRKISSKYQKKETKRKKNQKKRKKIKRCKKIITINYIIIQKNKQNLKKIKKSRNLNKILNKNASKTMICSFFCLQKVLKNRQPR